MKALFALLAVSVSTTVMAADADLLRCRALADAPAKLACYEAIPVGTAAPAPAQVPARPPAAVALEVAPTVGSAAAPAAAAADATFGLTASQMRKADQKDSVESTLVGTFSGWNPGTTFRLANGQTWRVADDSSASLYAREAPKVAVKRNFIGTYFLEVEGVNQAPRVRRVD